MSLRNVIAATTTAVAVACKDPEKLLKGLNPEQREIAKHDEGPLLAAAVAGSGKCVTGDTIVATPDGPRRIDQCKGLTAVSHSVDATTLDIQGATGTWLDMGISQIIEVETNNGFKIKGTPEHPLLVWRGEPVWTRLDQLTPEDLLMLMPGYGAQHGKQTVDPEEAYLLGLMMGDGWTCRREAKGNTISWSRGGEHLPPKFYELVSRFWSGTPAERTKPRTNSVSHCWGDKATYKRLQNLGCSFSSARDKHVPAWLKGASPTERKRFLQGYFDTDGSASGADVEAVSASERLARDIHQMLLSLGVVSRVSPKKVTGYDHTYWRIIISGDQLRIFADEIGFRYEKKKSSALSLIIEKPTNPNKGCYPLTGSLLYTLKNQWAKQGRWNGRRQALDGKAITDYLHDRRAPSKAKLLDMTMGCDGPIAKILKNLTNYYLDPVVSVKDVGTEHVYDFSIPSTHSFIANGIVSHNTHALVIRVAYLVSVRGVPASRVLAVTFSRKGADEMQERLDGLLGQGSGARIGTFHSLAYQILREEKQCEGWTVDGKDRYRYCIKDACGFRELNWKRADITMLSHFISLCKCDLARPHSDRTIEIAQDFRRKNPGPKTNIERMMRAYERAEELRRDRQLLTFDDMLLDAVELLQGKLYDEDGELIDGEPIRARWASRWSYVLQDEAQDQNLGQLLIGELLAKDHKNYMLVGDPSQTIYTWRGARPEKLLGFESTWSAKKVIMNRCYRCAPEIIEVANKVLESMDPTKRLDTQMIAEKKNEGEVTCTGYQDLDDEGESIAQQIKAALNSGHQPKDIAVLYRTNAQSRAPEEGLIGERIPYRIIGGTNFYERKEVRDLLAYLRLAEGRGTADDVKRCINTPFRFLGKAFVEKAMGCGKDALKRARKAGGRVAWPEVIRKAATLEKIQQRQRYSADDWADIIEKLHGIITAPDADENPEAKPARVLENIVRGTGYTEYLTRDEGEESTENSRVSNVRELIRAAYKFPTATELLDYIDKTIAASKAQRKGNEATPNKATLTTLHRSKGLGWPVVFVIGCNDGILPHARAEDIEEERRLFYVGTTRAMNELHISCVNKAAIGNQVRTLDNSVFLEEADLEPVWGGEEDDDEDIL